MSDDDGRTVRVAVLGCGVMGEAILGGILRAGWPASAVTFAERDAERTADVGARLGVAAAADNLVAVTGAGVVVVAVKPQDVGTVLTEVAPSIVPGTLVVSVAAGLTTAFYGQRLPAGTPVVRVMPNTPLLVGRGVSAISAGASAGEEHLRLVERLLATTGVVLRVPEEQQDAVTAISGSGPAYVFYLVEAMARAGAQLGLDPALAERLAVGTAVGAAELMARTGDSPITLRERVSSRGGTTVAALGVLDERGVRDAVAAAAEAARRRARELAEELSR